MGTRDFEISLASGRTYLATAGITMDGSLSTLNSSEMQVNILGKVNQSRSIIQGLKSNRTFPNFF